mmetsp:Transcript_7091/g.21641  ORF Transcript_7091/g.21641 Transcript_7091/m.21641 type:complete len:358 (-) Transcript_7091:458-1531(-)
MCRKPQNRQLMQLLKFPYKNERSRDPCKRHRGVPECLVKCALYVHHHLLLCFQLRPRGQPKCSTNIVVNGTQRLQPFPPLFFASLFLLGQHLVVTHYLLRVDLEDLRKPSDPLLHGRGLPFPLSNKRIDPLSLEFLCCVLEALHAHRLSEVPRVPLVVEVEVALDQQQAKSRSCGHLHFFFGRETDVDHLLGDATPNNLQRQTYHFSDLVEYEALPQQRHFHKLVTVDEERLATRAVENVALRSWVFPIHVVRKVVKFVGTLVLGEDVVEPRYPRISISGTIGAVSALQLPECTLGHNILVPPSYAIILRPKACSWSEPAVHLDIVVDMLVYLVDHRILQLAIHFAMKHGRDNLASG